jgi:hypothetical protein
MSETLHYTLKIKWSDEGQCYVMLAPEWEQYFGPIAEGATANRRRRDVGGSSGARQECAGKYDRVRP